MKPPDDDSTPTKRRERRGSKSDDGRGTLPMEGPPSFEGDLRVPSALRRL